MRYINNAFNEETAIVKENYPYGFRLRTKIRYWVESKKGKGDRFMSQTLNPKTQKWNKAKAGTYDAVVILVEEENGYIKVDGIHLSTDAEAYKRFMERIKDVTLRPEQQEILRIIRSYIKAYENVTFEVRAVKYKNKYTGEIKTTLNCMELGDYEKLEEEIEEDKKQEEIKKDINRLINYNYINDNGVLT